MRWVVWVGFGIAGLVLLSGIGWAYLQQEAQTYTDQAVAAEAKLQTQKQAEVQKEAKEVSDSLKLAVQVLSKEVLFSQLLKQLAKTIPSNVSLSGLTISELAGGVDITANTTDYKAATQLQVNLTDPANQIFEKADIVNINCATSTNRYPCSVTLRAQFTKNNPFLFINNKGS
jgi:Tfp pilus assembly protein PilN